MSRRQELPDVSLGGGGSRDSCRPLRGAVFAELDRLIAEQPSDPGALTLRDGRAPHKARIEQHAAKMRERARVQGRRKA